MAQEESMQKYTEYMYKEVCPKTTQFKKVRSWGKVRFIFKQFQHWDVKHKERSKEEGQQEKRKVGKGVMKESFSN